MTENQEKYWWEQDTERFIEEYEGVKELEQNDDIFHDAKWIIKAEQMIIEGKVIIQKHDRHFELVFPCFYPSECPIIYPINREERWSKKHQYGSGALCLEYGPDTWHPSYTAKNVILSLIDLLQGEAPIETSKGSSQGTVLSRRVTWLFA